MDADVLDAFLQHTLLHGQRKQVYNLCVMLMHAQRQPGDAVWQGLIRHQDDAVRHLAGRIVGTT